MSILVTDLQVNDQIGQGKIVWITSFIDKFNYKVILFVCILPDGTYEINISDRHRVLSDLFSQGTTYPSLPKAVKVLMEYAKNQCKLKHYA